MAMRAVFRSTSELGRALSLSLSAAPVERETDTYRSIPCRRYGCSRPIKITRVAIRGATIPLTFSFNSQLHDVDTPALAAQLRIDMTGRQNNEKKEKFVERSIMIKKGKVESK